MKRRGLNLGEAQIRQITRLLASGQHSGEIAESTGVSHDVVNRIRKQGRDYRRRPTKHNRCSGCGGLQTAPCLVCLARGAA